MSYTSYKSMTIFGPPGTGKTTRLINLVQEALESGTDPARVGFMSFSKKATTEARDRAIEKLQVNAKDLVWFRTLHSMAFRQLGLRREQVLDGGDLNALSKILGLPMTSSQNIRMDEGLLFTPGQAKGDEYYNMYNLSRATGQTLGAVFNQTFSDNMLYFRELEHVVSAIEEYKQETKKVDFVDMIERFIENGECPSFDLLIVDEAQDLVPLQWRMIHEVIVPRSDRVVFAGDDDQCIFSWMGVKVDNFLSSSEHKQVLDKSYRVPKKIHQFANNVVSRLSIRQDKDWMPTDEEGDITFNYELGDIDMSKGEWLILARTNFIANRIANKLRDMGYLFWKDNRWSISSRILESIETWLKLQKGESLSGDDLKAFAKMAVASDRYLSKACRRKISGLESHGLYDLNYLTVFCGMAAGKDDPWYDVIRIRDIDYAYITSVRRMGESILNVSKPRIEVSTIHRAKGGEADNVVLFTETSPKIQKFSTVDEEIRTFYVGITRARKTLHIVQSYSNYRFQL